MRNAADLLARYAAYHRDHRNIATHRVGVPMILFALGVLLARPAVALGSLTLTPAWVAFGLAAAWWLTRGSLAVGLAASGGTAALLLLAQGLGAIGTAAWLGWGLGLLLLGWLLQWLGHYYEGRKPALADDIAGLLIGPMFVAAEVLFAAGWKLELAREIERRAGPKFIRDLALPATR
ncbi:MAG: Mpo1-like protein [Pseudomonadota bacterium]